LREIILINVSGKDEAGLTASISRILARHGVNVLDIGQAVIHDSLSVGILVEVPEEKITSSVLKDVLFRTSELGVHVRFAPINEMHYQQWVQGQGKSRYIVTLLARKLTAAQISVVTEIIAANDLNIDNINRLSGRIGLAVDNKDAKACVEFSVRGEPKDPDAMRAAFLQAANELGADIAFQKDNAYRRNRRLVCFDMDSTLIETEVIDELAKAAGVGSQVIAITERAMRGELDFTQSFKERVALLKGLPDSVLKDIADKLPLTEGAENLISTLKVLGYKTAILSGGFNYFGRVLQERLGIDYVYANELEIAHGKITGNVVGQVVDGERKAVLLQALAKKEGITLDQVIAVGDGANDLPMLGLAGLGIAFRAKPLVKENAEQSISTLGLDGILYLLGVRDSDRLELLQLMNMNG
jgi:phosphoserine phosphatase